MSLARFLSAACCCLTTVVSAQSAPTTVRAFTGARVIDGTDRPPITNATIVVRDGRIVAVGPAARITIPAGAERVALDGKTVMPGLINAHGHVTGAKDLDTYAAYGVLDAIKMVDCPIIEVHISNIHRREAEWRSRSIMTKVVTGTVAGLGAHGYELAVRHLIHLQKARA